MFGSGSCTEHGVAAIPGWRFANAAGVRDSQLRRGRLADHGGEASILFRNG